MSTVGTNTTHFVFDYEAVFNNDRIIAAERQHDITVTHDLYDFESKMKRVQVWKHSSLLLQANCIKNTMNVGKIATEAFK